jgi:alpha-1,6-mannosyltransferase
VTRAPALRLLALGSLLLLALTICSSNFGDRGGPSFMLWLIVAGLAYLFAVRELFSTPDFPKRVVVLALALSAGWHILFLLQPPGVDDDIHRYVWDGRVQRLGYNPYTLVPNDPKAAVLHTSETRTLNHPDLPTPYPPGAELFFRAVTAIHESVFAFKVVFVLCDFAIVFVLLDLLRRTGKGDHWVLVFAWNPLLAIEVAGSGHIDILGALLLVISAAALWRSWRAVAAVTLALAIAVKFLPLVLVPLYWRRVRLRDAGIAVFIFGLLYLPFLERGRIAVGSLGTYVRSFWFNDPVFAALERVMSPQIAAGLAVLAGLLTATWLRRTSNESLPKAFAWPMTASLLFAPVIYPWYLLWLLPFLQSVSTLPVAVWTISIIPTYYVWHLRALGRPWLVPGWLMLLEYGAIAVAGLVIALRRVMRASVTHVSHENAAPLR